ncbi:MAG: hypothetical protein RIM99_06435 [Cyclobacteriaceae bacterium]
MSQFHSEKVHILDIEILRFSISEDDSDAEDIHYTLEKCDIGFNLSQKLAKIIFDIALEGYCSCSFKIEVLFEVDNIEELVEKDKETDKIHPTNKDFYPHLFAIAYSTIRGIVYTKTLGVRDGGILLPILHPKRFYRKFLKEEKKETDSKTDPTSKNNS